MFFSSFSLRRARELRDTYTTITPTHTNIHTHSLTHTDACTPQPIFWWTLFPRNTRNDSPIQKHSTNKKKQWFYLWVRWCVRACVYTHNEYPSFYRADDFCMGKITYVQVPVVWARLDLSRATAIQCVWQRERERGIHTQLISMTHTTQSSWKRKSD